MTRHHIYALEFRERFVGVNNPTEDIYDHDTFCHRYYVGESTATLWERWFFCTDLGSQLGPVISEFFQSEECRSNQPGLGSFLCPPCFEPDSIRQVGQSTLPYIVINVNWPNSFRPCLFTKLHPLADVMYSKAYDLPPRKFSIRKTLHD